MWNSELEEEVRQLKLRVHELENKNKIAIFHSGYFLKFKEISLRDALFMVMNHLGIDFEHTEEKTEIKKVKKSKS